MNKPSSPHPPPKGCCLTPYPPLPKGGGVWIIILSLPTPLPPAPTPPRRQLSPSNLEGWEATFPNTPYPPLPLPYPPPPFGNFNLEGGKGEGRQLSPSKLPRIRRQLGGWGGKGNFPLTLPYPKGNLEGEKATFPFGVRGEGSNLEEGWGWGGKGTQIFGFLEEEGEGGEVVRYNYRLTLFTYTNLFWIYTGFYHIVDGVLIKRVPTWDYIMGLLNN